MFPLTTDEKHILDVLGTATAVGAWMSDTLPSLLIVLTAIWTLIRIWETDTVKRLTGRFKDGENTDHHPNY